MKKFIYTEIRKSSDEQTEQEACVCFDCAVMHKLFHAPHLDTYLVEADPNLDCEFHEEGLSGG